MIVGGVGAGMASGINSTFRQVGIATGITLLGTLFSNNVDAFGPPELAGDEPMRNASPAANVNRLVKGRGKTRYLRRWPHRVGADIVTVVG